jgi:hypothetical protein
VLLGSWLLALWAFSQICLNLGGGPCRSELNLPEPVMLVVLVWAPLGLFVVPTLLGAALLMTVLQARKRRRRHVRSIESPPCGGH